MKTNLFIIAALAVLPFIPRQSETPENLPARKIAQARTITRNRVIEPERTIKDVHEDSKSEKVVQLKNARIVIADYDLIRRDFPQIKNLSNPEIDDWILKQVAYVSIPQAAQQAVNTKIPVTEEMRMAYRPPDYGRALVYPMLSPADNKTELGLIDVKGAGSLNPGQRDHGNGVATLGECVREFLYENLMRDVLDDADLPNKTVASYAVIDAGFGVVHKDGSSSPAGLYLRQAQHRTPNSGAWLDANVRAKLQSIFHKYGIDPNKNIQGTLSDDIFDFGHYVVKDDLPEADPAKQIPFDVWGYNKDIKADLFDRWFYSKKDNPWNWSHELADAFANGRANRHDAWTHFTNLLNPARAKLTTFREKTYALDGYSAAHDVMNYLKRMQMEKDSFIIENIKMNLLHKNKFEDKVWSDHASLNELAKSLKIIRHDHETAQLQFMIVQKALGLNQNDAHGLPEEIGRLYKSLPAADLKKLLAEPAAAAGGTCADMAKGIMAH